MNRPNYCVRFVLSAMLLAATVMLVGCVDPYWNQMPDRYSSPAAEDNKYSDISTIADGCGCK